MYCTNCGASIDNSSVVCIHCGAATGIGMHMQQTYKAPVDPDEKANGGFIALALFIPIVGIILGAVESSNGKKRAGKAYIIAGVCSMCFWLLFSIVLTLFLTFFPFIILMFT